MSKRGRLEGCLALLAALVLAASLAGCARGISEAGETGPRIVCTSFPCYDFARAVLGSDAGLTLLIKPGAEVHSYEPAPPDVRAIAECDLFICIGGESDVWADDVLATFGADAPRQLRLIDSVEAVEEQEIEGMTVHAEAGDSGEIEYDEHVWTSPVNAERMVAAVRDALCALLPERSGELEANARAYLDEIADIDAQLRALVDGAARRELVFGDRFPFLYLAREYGLTCWAAFPSCAAESEPSARTLAFLIEKIREDGIPAVYQIELSRGLTAQTIAEETGAQVLTLQSAQNLSEADFAAGATYVSLMRENIEALRKGLN